MSEISSFIILRLDKKKKITVDDQKIKAAYKYSGINIEKDEVFKKKVNEKDIFPYVASERLKYINHFTKEELDKIIQVDFNSMFTCLKETFNLTPYSQINETIELSAIDAETMIEAINYLLAEKYDRFIEEDVLNNMYIKIFGQEYTPYNNYYLIVNKNDKDEDGNSNLFTYNESFLEEKLVLKRVKTVLSMYLELVSDCDWQDLKYVLLYTV